MDWIGLFFIPCTINLYFIREFYLLWQAQFHILHRQLTSKGMTRFDIVYLWFVCAIPSLVIICSAPRGHECCIVMIRLTSILLHGSTQHAQQVHSELCSDPFVAALPSHPVQKNIFPRFGHMPYDIIGESQVLGGEMQLPSQFRIGCLYPRIFNLL